ncbi:hypothetical protein F994_02403 [Acinetobacter bohemicus ANC 3994]|uniref:Uncharacterized protein n=1 Tax=Acinetobacter bohemicus ANC 3994 TaxID=1217715 RepID=N8Q8M6_9GAMM|nr:hypothetical protein [Acinetobacter bohemicus]ENU19543.1 hypothetical protein F994_02403 [Acinetobacter bohemicus ANC 3994]
MIFDLLDHEQEFLTLLDQLIAETPEFENKLTLVDKKLTFINNLIELEKYRLEHRFKTEQHEDEHALKRYVSRRNKD